MARRARASPSRGVEYLAICKKREVSTTTSAAEMVFRAEDLGKAKSNEGDDPNSEKLHRRTAQEGDDHQNVDTRSSASASHEACCRRSFRPADRQGPHDDDKPRWPHHGRSGRDRAAISPLTPCGRPGRALAALPPFVFIGDAAALERTRRSARPSMSTVALTDCAERQPPSSPDALPVLACDCDRAPVAAGPRPILTNAGSPSPARIETAVRADDAPARTAGRRDATRSPRPCSTMPASAFPATRNSSPTSLHA